MGLVATAPMELSYKMLVLLLPGTAAFFILRPFLAILALLVVRPELELFSESGLLKYFSIVPIVSLFVLLAFKKFDFCWKKMKFLYIFIALSILSVAYSVSPAESVVNIMRLVAIVCVYLITFNMIETKDDAFKFLSCFPLAMILPLLIGLNQFVLGQTYVTEETQFTRVEGLFVLANNFARFIFITLFGTMPILYYIKDKRYKKLIYILIIVAIGTIFLLKVRSVFVGVLLALFLLVFYTPALKKRLPLIIFLSIVVLIPLGIEMFDKLLHPDLTKIYGGETFYWRLEIWKELFYNAVPKRPIIGFGAGTSLVVDPTYTKFPTLPHNDFLRILLENGVVGLIPYLAFFIGNLFGSYKEMKIIKEYKYLNICAFIMIFSFLVMSSASNIFYGVTYFWYFFSYLAITHKLNAISLSEKQGSKQ